MILQGDRVCASPISPLSVERMITHSLENTSCTLISVPSSEDSEKQSHSDRLLTKHLLQASSCALIGLSLLHVANNAYTGRAINFIECVVAIDQNMHRQDMISVPKIWAVIKKAFTHCNAMGETLDKRVF